MLCGHPWKGMLLDHFIGYHCPSIAHSKDSIALLKPIPLYSPFFAALNYFQRVITMLNEI